MKLKLTEEAENDFRSMFGYYFEETKDAEYTLSIIRDIRGKLDLLKLFPMRYPAINPDDETIRTMHYKRYAIQYQVEETAVIILNIKHTSTLA